MATNNNYLRKLFKSIPTILRYFQMNEDEKVKVLSDFEQRRQSIRNFYENYKQIAEFSNNTFYANCTPRARNTI